MKPILLPNGKCNLCKARIRRIDKYDANYLFYSNEGVREHKEKKGVYLIKCPNCNRYILLNCN